VGRAVHGLIPPEEKEGFLEVFQSEIVACQEEIRDTALKVPYGTEVSNKRNVSRPSSRHKMKHYSRNGQIMV
jgi:hypothetical protein